MPPANWVNGAPLANGDLGVLAYGAPEALTFSFGKTDLWDYTPLKRPNFPAVPLAALRQALASQDNLRFEKIQDQTNKQAVAAVATGKPGGMLRIELHPASLASGYRQRLSFAHAKVVQSWRVVGDRSPSRRGPDSNVTVVTSRDSKNPLAEARRNLDAAQTAGFETLRATHREWWHGYWGQYTANRLELAEPLYRLMSDVLPRF